MQEKYMDHLCAQQAWITADCTKFSRCSKMYSVLTARTGIPAKRMCLKKHLKLLKQYATLASCGLGNCCVIDLHTPGYGGGGVSIHLIYNFISTIKSSMVEVA